MLPKQYLVSWIPTLSNSFCFNAIVQRPKGDRCPSNIDFNIGTDGRISVKSKRVLHDAPLVNLFQLATCEEFYDSKKLLSNALLFYTASAEPKKYSDLESDLTDFGVDPSLAKCKYLKDCHYLHLTIGQCKFSDLLAKQQMEKIYKAERYEPNGQTFVEAEALFFNNGLIIIKVVNIGDWENNYLADLSKDKGLDLSKVSNKFNSFVEDGKLDDNLTHHEMKKFKDLKELLEDLNFEFYSFLRDCWHSHKYHHHSADKIISGSQFKNLTEDTIKIAIQSMVSDLNERCLHKQRSDPNINSDGLRDIDGLLMYSYSLNKHLDDNKDNVVRDHLPQQIALLESKESKRLNNYLASNALFFSATFAIIAIYNDMLSVDNLKAPTLLLSNPVIYYFWAAIFFVVVFLLKFYWTLNNVSGTEADNPRDFTHSYLYHMGLAKKGKKGDIMARGMNSQLTEKLIFIFAETVERILLIVIITLKLILDLFKWVLFPIIKPLLYIFEPLGLAIISRKLSNFSRIIFLIIKHYIYAIEEVKFETSKRVAIRVYEKDETSVTSFCTSIMYILDIISPLIAVTLACYLFIYSK